MDRVEKDEAIQQMVSLAMRKPTVESFGKGCLEILGEHGAFRSLEEIGLSITIKNDRITSF